MIVLLPGDGIGRIVVPEAVRVLEAVGFAAEYVHAEIGWDCWVRDGNPLPERTVELLRRHRVGLLGAITSKSRAEAEAALPRELRGASYRSPVLSLRQKLALEIAIRPCRTLEGNPLRFVRRRGEQLESPRIDATVVMQNTECLYSGVEWGPLPDEVRRVLDEHPQMAQFAKVPSSELAVSARVVSRGGCERAARAAFEYARRHGVEAVTLCDKWGVMRDTGGLMLEAAGSVAREFPEIRLEAGNIDAQFLMLTRQPERAQVFLTSALMGDILSDGLAGLVGGLGFVPCANLGEACAVFEPTHGSAPKYAELEPSIVNPIAAILAAAMLLEHVGEGARAARVRRAVEAVVREGRVRTFDMLSIPGGSEAVTRGAATTRQMTDAILAALPRA